MLRIFEKMAFFNSYPLSSVLASVILPDRAHFSNLAKQMIKITTNTWLNLL